MDAIKKMEISPHLKITAALRNLCYGTFYDQMDELLSISESIASESQLKFCNAIIDLYGEEYLRFPNKQEEEIVSQRDYMTIQARVLTLRQDRQCDHNAIIAYGAGNFDTASPGYPATPNKRLFYELKKRCRVRLVPEYRTVKDVVIARMSQANYAYGE
ncbi:hypothetical protein MP228_012271 [Amoeboaphelidium protococcarum]|nr:hypothetical protein MP228_012271 [Amoeboaphelidium protococcarum]